MKRLFYIRNTITGDAHVVEGNLLYFDKKMEAKKARDSLNGVDKEGNQRRGPNCVKRGPDHWLGAS